MRKANHKILLKLLVLLLVFSGWFYSAWSGGIMGLWACLCTGFVCLYFGRWFETSLAEDLEKMRSSEEKEQ